MREKKQKRSLIIASAVFVLLLAVYFAVVLPMMKDDTVVTPPELVEGEALGPNNLIMMFPQVSRADMKEIYVSNEHGEFTLVRDGETFKIKGFENVSCNTEGISSIVVASGYTVTSQRLTDKATDAELEKYGLAERDVYWKITCTDGREYKVFVGDKLVSEAGYYAMLEGRENCVYILSSSIETSLLRPVEAFVNPILCLGLTDQNYYLIDNFTVMHGEDVFVLVKQSKKGEFVNPDAQAETKMVYPAGYKTDDTYFMSNVASRFVSMVGEEVVYMGEDKDELEKFGLASPYYSVYFTFTNGQSEVEYYFFVSEKQADGYYYAVSNLYGFKVVVKCKPENFSWLENKLISWVDDYPIAINILRVDSLSVETVDGKYDFDLTHGVTADEVATLEIKGPDGFYLNDADVYNFRELYKDFLAIQIMGELEFTDSEIDDIVENDDSHMTTVTFNLIDGSVQEFKFYRYSTGRAILSANDSKNFFVYDDWLLKIRDDVQKLLSHLEIDSHSKN